PSREAVIKAVNIAKENNIEVIFELDYRPYTWKTDAVKGLYMSLIAQKADIVLGTRDEFNVLEENKGYSDKDSVKHLFQYDRNILVIKHAVKGSTAFTRDGRQIEESAYKTAVYKTYDAEA